MTKSWKTTTLGVITIATAILGAVKAFLATGAMPDVTSLIVSISAGWGLIAAKDSNVTGGAVAQ